MALTKAPTYGRNSFYAPVAPKPKPKPPQKTYGANSFYAPVGAFAQPATVAPVAVPQAKPIGVPPVVKKSFGDYVAEGIPGDWEVQDAEAAMGSQMAKLRAAFTGDIRNAMVNLGLPQDAGVTKEFGSYIDQDTIQKAIQNKYSTASQIAQQEAVQKANTEAALAARGSLRSGATTNRLTGIAAEGERSRWQAVQDFLTGARGGLSGLGTAESTLQGQIAAARANAAQRLAAQYGWDNPDAPITETGPVVSTAKPTPAAPKETAWQRALRLRSEALNRRYADRIR